MYMYNVCVTAFKEKKSEGNCVESKHVISIIYYYISTFLFIPFDH